MNPAVRQFPRRSAPFISLVFSALYLCLAASSSAAVTNVVPNGLANVEGNSSMVDVFTNSSFRMQMVFDASQFVSWGPKGVINLISFRIDDSATGNAGYTFAGSTIQLSTTQKSADSLSPVFAENIGPDVRVIRNGAITLGSIYTPDAAPQPFNSVTGISGDFLYDPSRGNLLLDIIVGGGQILFPGRMDAQNTFGDGVSRVWAPSEEATVGMVDTLGLVTRFTITPVPEPSTWLITAIAALCFWATRRCKAEN